MYPGSNKLGLLLAELQGEMRNEPVDTSDNTDVDAAHDSMEESATALRDNADDAKADMVEEQTLLPPNPSHPLPPPPTPSHPLPPPPTPSHPLPPPPTPAHKRK